MKLPTRIRVRTMMTVVALVALGFGVAFELNNHAKRDRITKRMLTQYRDAAEHFRRALECQTANNRLLPYKPVEREMLLANDRCERGRWMIPKGGFRSWQEEFNYHMYWGGRIYDEPQGLQEDILRALEAKLILP